jgi:hypothetical protein
MKDDKTITNNDVDDASWHVWLLYESGQYIQADLFKQKYIDKFINIDSYFNVNCFTMCCISP